MLSQRRGHTPQELNPTFQPTRACPCPPATPTHQPSSLPPPCHLRSPSLAAPALKWVPLMPRVAGCWPAVLPVYLTSLANGNPSHSGKGGVHSSRKQRLGEGCECSCYTFCESVHMEGKGKQSRPTHLLKLVNAPLVSTLFTIGLYTHAHTMTHCLINLIRYMQGLCIESSPSIQLLPIPSPFWGGETFMSPFEKRNGYILGTWVEPELQLRDMRRQSEPTITKRWVCP